MKLGQFLLSSISLSIYKELLVTVKVPIQEALMVQQAVIGAQAALREGKQVKVSLATETKKRSLSQNAYAWALMDKIAIRLRSTPEEVYETMLKRYGVHAYYAVPKEAVNLLSGQHGIENLGTKEVKGELFTSFRVTVGSSRYNTEQMRVLLDGIISECGELEIDTEIDGWEG